MIAAGNIRLCLQLSLRGRSDALPGTTRAPVLVSVGRLLASTSYLGALGPGSQSTSLEHAVTASDQKDVSKHRGQQAPWLLAAAWKSQLRAGHGHPSSHRGLYCLVSYPVQCLHGSNSSRNLFTWELLFIFSHGPMR